MTASSEPLVYAAEGEQAARSRGSMFERIRSTLFLLPAWFAPHSKLRVLFHRLRGVNIGKDVEIGYFCVLDNVHPSWITIEERAVVAAGAVLLTHDNSHYYAQDRAVRCGPLRICKRAFIGIHSVILPGVTVGQQAIVGAMSVVTSDVPDHSVVAGIPARIIRGGNAGMDERLAGGNGQ
jgi:acetyltransferase-like isoleucine patch superfamily enzyme